MNIIVFMLQAHAPIEWALFFVVNCVCLIFAIFE